MSCRRAEGTDGCAVEPGVGDEGPIERSAEAGAVEAAGVDAAIASEDPGTCGLE